VGDDSQSIYAFRGGPHREYPQFQQEDFPEAAEFRLEQNYRSTQTGSQSGQQFDQPTNKRRLRKRMFFRGCAGRRKIELNTDIYRQRRSLYGCGFRCTNKQYATSDGFGAFAIFYRTNAQSRLFEEALRRRQTFPTKVYGGFSFYEREPEVKDFVVAYMASWWSILMTKRLSYVPSGTPARGIGTVSLQKLNTAAAFAEMSSYDTFYEGDLAAAGLKGNIAGRMKAFADILEAVRSLQEEGKNAFELDYGDWPGCPAILAHLKEDTESIEGMSRLANVEELFNSLKSFL